MQIQFCIQIQNTLLYFPWLLFGYLFQLSSRSLILSSGIFKHLSNPSIEFLYSVAFFLAWGFLLTLFFKSVMPFFIVSNSLPKLAILSVIYSYTVNIITLNSTSDLPISGATISKAFFFFRFFTSWTLVCLVYYILEMVLEKNIFRNIWGLGWSSLFPGIWLHWEQSGASLMQSQEVRLF